MDIDPNSTLLEPQPLAIENRPLFPLDKEVMTEVLQPVSTAAFIGISTSLVLAGQGVPDDTNVYLHALLNSALFLFFPIGIVCLIASAAVKKRPRLIGFASGFLLSEICFVTVVGGIVTVVKSDAPIWLASLITVVILVCTVFAWSLLCSYPKCLRFACCNKAEVNNAHNSDQQDVSP